jgi:hypothetical protein
MRTSITVALAFVLSFTPFGHTQTAAPSKPPTGETKPPAGVDPKLTSTDPDYGYTKEKPIKVGSREEFGGPTAERVYLSTLRDEAGMLIAFERAGSFGPGPDGNILDRYDVQTTTGRKLMLFIDMYHPKNDPKKQLAPKGLFKAR